MTLPNIFDFMNFFVRPTVKKRRQKCAKKGQKCAPPHPLDPPKSIILVGGVETLLTKGRKQHNFAFFA